MKKGIVILLLGQLLIVFAVVCISSCGLLKDIGRTANDAAVILCRLVAADKEDELDGLSPAEWCMVHDNLQPFLDEVLSAKRNAARKAGFSK